MDKTKVNEVIEFLKSALIRNGVNVDSIALFGSALNGKMDIDSDIDLIIVSQDFVNLDIFERAKLTMKPEFETIRNFEIPMDIINLSPEEFNESSVKFYYNPKIVA